MKNGRLVGLLLIIVVLLLSQVLGFMPLVAKENALENAFKQLGILFIIALFVERSIQVFLSNWRGAGADDLDYEIEKATKDLNDSEKRGDSEEVVTHHKETLDEAVGKRIKFRNTSRHWALITGWIAGIIIAALGVRLLQHIVEIPPGTVAATASPEEITEALERIKKFNLVQYSYFKLMDILLTGSMIAGGSDAINQIMKVYNSFTQTTVKRNTEAGKSDASE